MDPIHRSTDYLIKIGKIVDSQFLKCHLLIYAESEKADGSLFIQTRLVRNGELFVNTNAETEALYRLQ